MFLSCPVHFFVLLKEERKSKGKREEKKCERREHLQNFCRTEHPWVLTAPPPPNISVFNLGISKDKSLGF